MVRRGPGVVGTMARTAVVAGTATAVSRGVHGRMDRRAAEKETLAQANAAPAAGNAAAAGSPTPTDAEAQLQAAQMQAYQSAGGVGAGTNDVAAQLEKLEKMKSTGALTTAEYDAAKKKLLG